MFTKIKNYVKTTVITLGLWLVSVQAAFAENDATSTISEQTADVVSGKIITLVADILKPFGAMVLFITIVFLAFKIITGAGRPEKRAETMSAFPYIIGGGILLGAAALAAGFILGLWTKLQ